MLVCAVDPGGHTGLASWYDGSFQSKEVDDPMQAVNEIAWAIHEWDAVVCENFIPRPKVTWQPDALHIIGALRYVCWKQEVPFVLQTPAQAKTFATDDRLKAVGFHTPGKGHANDAARHLLRYLVRSKLISLADVGLTGTWMEAEGYDRDPEQIAGRDDV